MYIYNHKNWPDFTWDNNEIIEPLVKVRSKQSLLKGYLAALGFAERNSTTLETITLDVLKTSEIEGENLNAEQVRSSIARHLGIEIAEPVYSDKNIDGVVEMMLDATQNYGNALTKDRIFGWHSSLFPSGKSGMYKILTGDWRDDSTGPMQVVSGAMGKEKVHYQAPEAHRVNKEMELFMNWYNAEQGIDSVIKAAIAHLWFVIIHPFEDGNGRIGRAIIDMQLTRADNDRRRFYSMSAQIRTDRNEYYEMLEKTQQGGMGITPWLTWFLNCLYKSLSSMEKTVELILKKASFWELHTNTKINERQRLMINKLFTDFYGKLNTSKWAKITKCSTDTALNDITDLISKDILKKEASGGRSTNYTLK